MAQRMLRNALASLVPPWMAYRVGKGPTPPGLVNGFKVAYATARLADLFLETAWEGLLATMPGVGTPTALSLLGQARGMLQGPAEPNASYSARLTQWLATWANCGSAEVMAQQIQAYMTGQGSLGAGVRPIVRVFDRSGNWVTANPSGSLTLTTGLPLPWDTVGGTDKQSALVTSTWWSDMWIVIAPASGTTPIYPYYTGTSDPAWLANFGATPTLGGGLQIPLAVSQGLLSIVKTWKAAHTYFRAIILAEDTTSFSPTGPSPADGYYGNWSLDVAGVQTPHRSSSHRYCIPPNGG